MNIWSSLRQRSAKLLAIALVVSVTWTGTAKADAAPVFNDISTSYAKAQITDLAGKNIMNGTTDHTFDPERPISRAEFIAVLDRALNLQPVASAVPAFVDVTSDAWYYGWVQAGVELGIVDGVGPVQFAPKASITRQEASALLVKALKQSTTGSSAASLYTDSALIASWAVPYVTQIQQMGLMTGDQGEFRPNDPITRQETAVVIDKLLTDTRWSTALNTSAASLIQVGWQYNQTEEQYEQSVKNSTINTLSPRWFFVDAANGVEDAAKETLVTWAAQNGKKVWPLVGNRSDKEYTHQLLSDSAKSDAAITQLMQYVEKYKLDGLNLDFENVDPLDRQSLTVFVSNLASKLHGMNKTLSICVSPDTQSEWTDAFDYAALGQSADYMILMSYDEHWSTSIVAGSVSSLPWLTQGLQKLLASVPANKTILALPFYTRDWIDTAGVATSTELTIREQNEIVRSTGMRPLWDSALAQYASTYWVNNVLHSMWLEDSRSLSAKVQAGLTNHVSGFAFWYTGAESPDVWTSLQNRIRYHAYSF